MSNYVEKPEDVHNKFNFIGYLKCMYCTGSAASHEKQEISTNELCI